MSLESIARTLTFKQPIQLQSSVTVKWTKTKKHTKTQSNYTLLSSTSRPLHRMAAWTPQQKKKRFAIMQTWWTFFFCVCCKLQFPICISILLRKCFNNSSAACLTVYLMHSTVIYAFANVNANTSKLTLYPFIWVNSIQISVWPCDSKQIPSEFATVFCDAIDFIMHVRVCFFSTLLPAEARQYYASNVMQKWMAILRMVWMDCAGLVYHFDGFWFSPCQRNVETTHRHSSSAILV